MIAKLGNKHKLLYWRVAASAPLHVCILSLESTSFSIGFVVGQNSDTINEQTYINGGYMAKTILNLAISLDGYVAGTHDEIDWMAQYDDPSEFGFDTFIPTVGAIIVGQRSYEIGVAQGWFKGQAYGPSPIFVICREVPLEPSQDADFRFITDGIDEAYQKAALAAGNKNIYLFGGPSIIQQFINKDLVDELHLAIVPVLLGQGIPLFANLHERRIPLERLRIEKFARGLTGIQYKVIK